MRVSTAASQAAITAIQEAFRSNPGAGTLPGWLDGPRGDALAAFARIGFPPPRAEEWKYTNLAEIIDASAARLNRTPAAADPANVGELLQRIPRRAG
ncbi:MAG: hypothetical protein KJO76_04660, partial [Gammaproteobacteria bacterium]|nr:hypothetical protein [Gammaproteobacteria bacterium]